MRVFQIEDLLVKIFDFDFKEQYAPSSGNQTCCCFYGVNTKKAQNYCSKSDHSFPKENNQGRSPCMQGQSP